MFRKNSKKCLTRPISCFGKLIEIGTYCISDIQLSNHIFNENMLTIYRQRIGYGIVKKFYWSYRFVFNKCLSYRDSIQIMIEMKKIQ